MALFCNDRWLWTLKEITSKELVVSVKTCECFVLILRELRKMKNEKVEIGETENLLRRESLSTFEVTNFKIIFLVGLYL
jgi:hypothetical protein